MSTDRDRDREGRPRNARPRDAFGRPLPRGAEGVEGPPEDLDLPPEKSLDEAQRLIDTDRAFHAHEVLEGTWKGHAPPDQRALWQGLAQLAVGLTHLQRGNAVGATRLLRRGADRIAAYADDPPHEIDVAVLRDWARGIAERIETEGIDTVGNDDRRPRLRRTSPDRKSVV